jgi:hypothetical protein
MSPQPPTPPEREPSPVAEAFAVDPRQFGAWIDRRIEEGIPIAGDEPPRAVVAPHIDPVRGARVYGSAYRPLRGHPAERIVILGIGHAIGCAPFAMIPHPIPTPWGSCPVDTKGIRSLCEDLPFDPIAAAAQHAGETSILHQALFLRRVMDGWERRKVIPILCSFPWRARSQEGSRSGPREDAQEDSRDRAIELFVRRLAASMDDRTLVVAGVDLAHVGRGHGDGGIDLDDAARETERLDGELLERVAAGDLAGFGDRMDRERDARRICGYPALWTLMRILPGASGIVVDYGQAIDRPGGTLVSYAALVLR